MNWNDTEWLEARPSEGLDFSAYSFSDFKKDTLEWIKKIRNYIDHCVGPELDKEKSIKVIFCKKGFNLGDDEKSRLKEAIVSWGICIDGLENMFEIYKDNQIVTDEEKEELYFNVQIEKLGIDL